MLRTERQQLVGLGGNDVGLATPLMQGASMRQGGGQAVWARAFPGASERHCDALHGLVRIAKEPQAPGRTGEYQDLRHERRSGRAHQRLLQTGSGRSERPELEEDTSKPLVRLHEPARIVHPLGVGEKLLRHLTGGL